MRDLNCNVTSTTVIPLILFPVRFSLLDLMGFLLGKRKREEAGTISMPSCKFCSSCQNISFCV